MRNLDLIKNINKFNRVSRKSRRRSFSGIEGKRYSKNTSEAITPAMLSAQREKIDEISFDVKSDQRKKTPKKGLAGSV
jgi:hypothetical protein